MIRDGRWLETLVRRRDRHKYYSSSVSNKCHDCHCYHPYRSDNVYLSDEFKKSKPSILMEISRNHMMQRHGCLL